jgi:squalene-associated FAD-dependent desaturase
MIRETQHRPIDSSRSLPIVIIGGGFAGLAAAVDLAEAGRRVLLLERRAFLGGRAYSFTDKATGDTIDNGQHLMMGCYTRTLGFLEKIGATGKLKFQDNPRVDFLQARENGVVLRSSFKCPPLPAPLHLLGGLARLRTIGWRDRIGALRVGLELRRLNGDRASLASITVREWLTRLGQSDRIQHCFWDPVALATLNESPDRASADMFARVLEQAFMRSRRDSAMVISKVGLSDLYTGDAKTFVESRGGEIRLNAGVERVEFLNGRAAGVRLMSGERINAEAVISAVPYFALERMLPDEAANRLGRFSAPGSLNSAPIVSINLWYERPVADLEFAGLLDSRIEWVFNKNAIAGEGHYPQRDQGDRLNRQHLALVISGAHRDAGRPKNELIGMAAAEMRRFFPAARNLSPYHAFVVRERDATISHTVGVTALRPQQSTEFDSFFLAGDWTDTGLPATIEGAVWSGQECAQLVRGRIGTDR